MSRTQLYFTVHTICWYNAGSMLGQRLRRWPNITPALAQHLVTTGMTVWPFQESWFIFKFWRGICCFGREGFPLSGEDPLITRCTNAALMLGKHRRHCNSIEPEVYEGSPQTSLCQSGLGTREAGEVTAMGDKLHESWGRWGKTEPRQLGKEGWDST